MGYSRKQKDQTDVTGCAGEVTSMAEEESKVLRTREERLAFARSMNLFSTPFMREVFKDDKATQYVLRILTGKPDLTVKQNLTSWIHGTLSWM